MSIKLFIYLSYFDLIYVFTYLLFPSAFMFMYLADAFIQSDLQMKI